MQLQLCLFWLTCFVFALSNWWKLLAASLCKVIVYSSGYDPFVCSCIFNIYAIRHGTTWTWRTTTVCNELRKHGYDSKKFPDDFMLSTRSLMIKLVHSNQFEPYNHCIHLRNIVLNSLTCWHQCIILQTNISKRGQTILFSFRHFSRHIYLLTQTEIDWYLTITFTTANLP